MQVEEEEVQVDMEGAMEEGTCREMQSCPVEDTNTCKISELVHVGFVWSIVTFNREPHKLSQVVIGTLWNIPRT